MSTTAHHYSTAVALVVALLVCSVGCSTQVVPQFAVVQNTLASQSVTKQEELRALAASARERAAAGDDAALVTMLTAYREAAALGSAQSASRLGMLYFRGQEVEHNGVAAYTWLYLARHGFSEPAIAGSGAADTDSAAASAVFADHATALADLEFTLSLDEMRQVEAALAAWPKSVPPEASLHRPEEERPKPRDKERERLRRFPEPLYSPKDIADITAQAAQGDNAALVRLGKIYASGNGVPRDGDKAHELLAQAAGAGDADARLALANAYPGSNIEILQNYLIEIAEKGNAEAQRLLGWALLLLPRYKALKAGSDADEINKGINDKVGLGWLQKAVAQGSANAMYTLGKYYDELRNDQGSARKWYELAAQAGSEEGLSGWRSAAQYTRMSKAEEYRLDLIYLDCQNPADRLWVRKNMIRDCAGLSKAQVQQQKIAADAWLQKYPKAKLSASKRNANEAAFATGRDSEGRTALHRAVLANDVARARQLLADKADPNSLDYSGRTPLHMAALAKGMDAAALLPPAGAIIDAKNWDSDPPLCDAVEQGNTAAVRFLLSVGANPAWPDSRGECLLTVAAGMGNLAIVKLLPTRPEDLNQQVGSYRSTPLEAALAGNREDVVAFLLAAGADPNMVDNSGAPPLFRAVYSDQVPMVKRLLAAGAYPDTPSQAGERPLHKALYHNRADIVALLLAAKADPNSQIQDGIAPLYIAVEKNSPTLVKILLDAGARVDLPTDWGLTPLAHAVRNNSKESLEIAGLLLAVKANPNTQDKYMNMPLIEAVRQENVDMVRLLLHHLGNPNTLDKDGFSLLHTAVQRKLAKIVALLLNAGADPNARDKQGRTALDMTRDDAIITLLEQAGGERSQ